MSNLRFIMLGGFLGAGKTTTIAQLARHYTEQGLKVGVVTNDQADNLVDTNLFRHQGVPVREVPGACFCCRFDDLVGEVQRLEEQGRPDVILAEPVGSCTDLVATVVQPLKDLYAGRFEVAPYAVLFKPSHGLKILQGQQAGGFSPKAAYIFRKQLEEADAIIVNRIDELAPDDVETIRGLVQEQFPTVPILTMSAKTGEGLDALIELLDQRGAFGQRILEIDYDTYAEGEAELGWLNTTIQVESNKSFDVDEFLTTLIRTLAESLERQKGEVAHLKLIGMTGGGFGVANLVATGNEPILSLPSQQHTTEMELIVNARVAIDPVLLQEEIHRQINHIAERKGLSATFQQTQSLRPGRPTPTHRYAKAGG